MNPKFGVRQGCGITPEYAVDRKCDGASSGNVGQWDTFS